LSAALRSFEPALRATRRPERPAPANPKIPESKRRRLGSTALALAATTNGWTPELIAANDPAMNRAQTPDESRAESTQRCVAPVEREFRTCVACGEPLTEILEARPEYCFVCAVHAVCACADESTTDGA
jgi:hypothetical protein